MRQPTIYNVIVKTLQSPFSFIFNLNFKTLCFRGLQFILPDLIFGVQHHFQQYHGDQLQWWKTPEYPERTTDHGQATGELYHLRLRVECTLFVIYKAGREPTPYQVLPEWGINLQSLFFSNFVQCFTDEHTRFIIPILTVFTAQMYNALIFPNMRKQIVKKPSILT